MDTISLPIVLLALQLSAGVVATATDLRAGKIYNRQLALFALAGAAVYGVYTLLSTDWLRIGDSLGILTNALTSLVVAFGLFYTRFWSAGDAKLFCLMAVLMPFSLYPHGLLFPAFYLLAAIFSLAFVYALVESVYNHAVDSRRPPAERRSIRLQAFGKGMLLDWLLRYLAASLLLTLLYEVVGLISPQVVLLDKGLVLVLGMMLLVLLYKRLTTRVSIAWAIAFALFANAVYLLIGNGSLSSLLDVRGPLVALVALGVMQFVSKYDYVRIPVHELKPGMILSRLTVGGFHHSRVSGLPRGTTETTESRLTTNEVESIRAWSTAKQDNSHVVIASHVPFAPFILAGCVVYVALAYAALIH